MITVTELPYSTRSFTWRMLQQVRLALVATIWHPIVARVLNIE